MVKYSRVLLSEKALLEKPVGGLAICATEMYQVASHVSLHSAAQSETRQLLANKLFVYTTLRKRTATQPQQHTLHNK